MALGILSQPTIVENLTVCMADLTPMGPPANLVPLALASRAYYNTLRDNCFPDVFALIFERSFEMSALRRRLGPLSASDVAAELPRRFTSLKVIRRGSLDDPGLRDALMRAYFMLLEDDGENTAQITWSHLFETVKNILLCSLRKEASLDKETIALAIVLFSLLSQTISNVELDSEEIHELFASYAFSALHCPLADIPEREFYPRRRSASELGTLPSASHYIYYFGRSLRYNTPPLAAYAIQAYLAKYEKTILVVPSLPRVPLTSIDLRALPGVTKTFIDEYNTKIPRLRRRSQIPPSQQYDLIWRRVTSRADVDRHLTSFSLHELGVLSGSWHGTCLAPAPDMRLGSGGSMLGGGCRVPLQCRLREHYCSSMPCMAPVVQGDSGYLNAWLPSGSVFIEANDGLTIQDASGTSIARYKTFDRGRRSGMRRASRDPVDIIITGETDAQQSAAYGAFKFYGRVRPSDGLVIIVRYPIDPAQEYLGRDVFRGYLLSSVHMVGRRRHAWPEATTSYEMLWNLRRSED